MLLKSGDELKSKSDPASIKQHNELDQKYSAGLKEYEKIENGLNILEKRLTIVGKEGVAFKAKHQIEFLRTPNIRETFDSEIMFNASTVAEELGKLGKKPAIATSIANQQSTLFHSAGEKKPEPSDDPVRNPGTPFRGTGSR